MQQLELTREMIEADIAGFQSRIQRARDKQAALPAATTYKEGKKLKEKRRELQQEIKHVRALIAIAQDALDELN